MRSNIGLMKRLAIRLLTILSLVLMGSSIAYADSILITLTEVTQTGPSGSTVIFDATLTNISTTTIFLNGDTATTSSPFLAVDDNPFLSNAPASLGPGASSGPLAIFDVPIAPGATPGLYTLNSFSILGGPANIDFNTVGSTNFNVDVAVAPEPGTLPLSICGLLGLAARYRMCRR